MGWTTEDSYFDFRERKDFSLLRSVQTGCYPNDTGSSFLRVSRLCVKLTTYLHPVSKLKMIGALPPLEYTYVSSWHCA
jgi:hypothetical protein